LSWDDGAVGELSCVNPTWEDVERNIDNLSTPKHSIVILESRNGNTLTIAGDKVHGYLVFFTEDNKFHYAMANSENLRGSIQIVIGQQPGDYARKILVDKKTAQIASRTFFMEGRMDSQINWTSDDNPL
jgi:hypothetical protein